MRTFSNPEEKRQYLTQEPIPRLILTMALPAIVSMLISSFYNMADTFFVGQTNNPYMVAGTSLILPVFNITLCLAGLAGIGGGSLIARLLGQAKEQEARRVSAFSFYLALGIAALFSVGIAVFMHPILGLLGAGENTYEYARQYAFCVIVLGGIPTVLSNVLSNLIRSIGRSREASVGIILGGLLNIALDPLFMFVLLPDGYEVLGAGIATCLSNVLSVVYFLLCLVRQRNESVIGLHPRHLRHSRKYLGNILAIGFPSALQYALTVVAVAAQSRFVSQYTTEAVAALGIVKKLDQLPLYFSIGVSNGLLPLLAYHYAAGQQEKRRAAFRLGAGISLLFALVCLVLFEGFAPQLAALFIDDATTIHYAAGFLRRMVIAMPMMSLCYPLIIQFQAMGKARESLVCSILRKGVLDIPLLFLMDTLLPLYGCMWVQPMVDGISLVAATAFYRRLRRRGEA